MDECVSYFVNYNSSAILPIEYASLKVASEDCLIYLIDNGSTDGSDVALAEFLKSSGANFVFLRLPRNLGFSRAVNYAFRKFKSHYRYFVLLNNDLVPVKGVLAKLVDVMESGGYAGVQGTIMQMLRPDLVDNAGHIVDRFGLAYPVCRGFTFSCARDYCPSYLSGAFSIYRADVIKRLGAPFSDFYEAYLDDKLLGARLRHMGHKLFHKALVAGFHLGSATYGPRRVFKSPRWFKYVAVAELAPVASNAPAGLRLLAYLKFLASGVLASVFTGEDYVKPLVEVYKSLTKNMPEANLVKSSFFNLRYFLLQNPVKGIVALSMDRTCVSK